MHSTRESRPKNLLPKVSFLDLSSACFSCFYRVQWTWSSGGEFWSGEDMMLLWCTIVALVYLHNAWTNFNRQHSSYIHTCSVTVWQWQQSACHFRRIGGKPSAHQPSDDQKGKKKKRQQVSLAYAILVALDAWIARFICSTGAGGLSHSRKLMAATESPPKIKATALQDREIASC